jgi:ketosteroid isomerase-like protein
MGDESEAGSNLDPLFDASDDDGAEPDPPRAARDAGERAMLEGLLAAAYTAFNARDVDAVLRLMHADVEWPNGMEGGFLHGHAAIRAYWTRQWAAIDPTVVPERFAHLADGGVAVDVRQTVRNRDGVVLADRVVRHVHHFRDGLIELMQIR